jgi:uncharacterized protein YlxP (DUF503 family)
MAVLQRHKNTIYGLVTDLAQITTSVTNEATARAAADVVLQGNIDAEATRATAAEGVNATAITNEATARAAADTTLQSNITAEATRATAAEGVNAAAITAEASTARAAEAANASAITAETTRATAAEGVNATAISTETAARIAGDTAAQSYADGILAAFEAGDFQTLEDLVAVINSDSSTVGSFRKEIADIIDSAPEALNTLNEIATYINVNGTGDDVLTAITNSVTAAKAEIRGEVTAAYDTLAEVEDALDIINGSGVGSIAKVAADFAAADTTLQSNITAEATARAAADVTLQSNIGAEATTRAAGDVTLQGNIDAEATARAAADTTLQSNITAEATARTNADETLTTGLGNLSGVTDAGTARTNLAVYSKTEMDAALLLAGARFITEILTVTADAITLTHAPKDGVLFNFGTVRHTDANFVSYDIPATVGGSATVYNLAPNASGDFDGKAVVVQYAYTPA